MQFAGAVIASVGITVSMDIGFNVAGINPALVGINVAVTKFACGDACEFESTEMEMQAVNKVAIKKSTIIFLTMIFTKTSSVALWIPPQGHWRFVPQKFRASK